MEKITNKRGAELIAVKFTYALQAEGGHWLAFSDYSTDYEGCGDYRPLPAELARKAGDRAGMWVATRPLTGTEMDAWKAWGLV